MKGEKDDDPTKLLPSLPYLLHELPRVKGGEEDRRDISSLGEREVAQGPGDISDQAGVIGDQELPKVLRGTHHLPGASLSCQGECLKGKERCFRCLVMDVGGDGKAGCHDGGDGDDDDAGESM